ncbi:hypothetical protein [Pseudoalteromonas luteoviolacea]|uniref:hypothetical protein n=1 Tax=Pseudoalteromonas luteoviolacea TaxID=43657 RepID=UPI001B37508B|nr:hypothetical protein [Pseudoalteromonas luteoviolacea]MBQ4836488.1 hypothetical protein [Pseudoalteromonas luteoviolacea]
MILVIRFEIFIGPVFTGLSEESKVEFHGLAKSRNERPLTAAKQALGKPKSGTKLTLGHLHPKLFKTVLDVAPETKSTLVVIDEAMLKTAIQIIGFEQTTELMKLVQTQANSTFNQSVLKFIANGVQITIQIDPDMNRVVEVKLVDV